MRGSKDENLLTDVQLSDIELRIRFDHDGSLWFLDFNPDVSICDGGAGHISMTRDPAKDEWIFESFDDVACLQEQVQVGRGNKTTVEFRGNYAIGFAVVATPQ